MTEEAPSRGAVRLFEDREKEWLEFGNQTRQVVTASIPSTLSQSVRIPAAGRLLLGYGLPTTSRQRWTGGQVAVVVTIRLPDGKVVRVHRELLTSPRGGPVWINRVLDLSDYASKQVELLFSAGWPGPADVALATPNHRVAWRVPLLSSATESPSNVVVIALDTLRSDHLNTYGYDRDTSPTLSAFADRGAVFEQAFTQAPWTLPSFTSVMSGVYPYRHGVDNNDRALPADAQTLPRVLQAAGYHTAAFHGGGFVSSGFGFHRHFDHFEQVDGLRAVPRIVRWLQFHRSVPFFLFLHTYDVHAPYGSVPPEYHERFAEAESDYDLIRDKPVTIDGRIEGNPFVEDDYQRMRDLYDGEIRFVDDQLAHLFTALEQLELDRKTVVIVLSDHGEEFGEHGRYEHRNGHVFRELAQIPIIVVGPGIGQRQRVTDLVELVDVLPTVADMLQLDPHWERSLDGESMLPLISAERDPSDRKKAYTLTEEGDRRSLRTDRWTLVRTPEETLLFDRRSDPKEMSDVAAEFRTEADALSRLLDRVMSGESFAQATSEIDDETREALRALGYIR